MQADSHARFVGNVAPDDVSEQAAFQVAQAIADHLNDRELRKHPASGARGQGRIAALAEGVTRNVHRPLPLKSATWSDADWVDYFKADDVARRIHQRVKECVGQRKAYAGIAGSALYDHFPKVFGAGATLEQARTMSGLFALHLAVQAFYKAVFDRKTVRPGHIPRNADGLKHGMRYRRRNQDVASLVRLGKVIHYESAGGGHDGQSTALDNWPDAEALGASRYWTSDGQTDIKRNEALVRVWRGVVAHAQRTLTDWADPRRQAGDVFGSGAIAAVTGCQFDAQCFAEKAGLLFGDRADAITGLVDRDRRQLLGFTLQAWAALRNGSFHFKGRAGFVSAIAAASSTASPGTLVGDLWARDRTACDQRLRAVFEAAHMLRVLSQGQLDQLYDAVRTSAAAHAPQPRFRRILDRGRNWPELALPAAPNRQQLERQPKLLSQYTSLKLLYERAFPQWLDTAGHARLNAWIDSAKTRAGDGARQLNGDFAVARVAALPPLRDGEHYASLVDRLQALTATEFRVQRGYQVDSDAARRQAAFLEDFRCDIVAQAFAAFLDGHGFAWLLRFDTNGSLPDQASCRLEALPTAAACAPPAAWVRHLYFLLHVVPVGEVSMLLHQLRKWQLLEQNADGAVDDAIAGAMDAMTLYLDMHDARHDGGRAIAVPPAFRELFEQPADFDALFAPSADARAAHHVPVRGLREMSRFGDLRPLLPIFKRRAVKHWQVEELQERATGIAAAQARREQLHARWVKNRNVYGGRFADKDIAEYRRVLGEVTRYRHLAGHAYLNTQARLHRLAIQVLARLIDYAGLWERDLYFVSLAVVHLSGMRPQDRFDAMGCGYLRQGRIVEAVRNSELKGNLEAHFGADFLDRANQVGTRNDLVHFNMLRGTSGLNLTLWVNRTRRMVAYDRKLKNAVTTSVIELLAREGVELKWQCRDHDMTGATIRSRRATHLGAIKDNAGGVTEALHGDDMLHMLADLFGGTVDQQGPRRNIGRPAGGPGDRHRHAKNRRNRRDHANGRAEFWRQKGESC